MNDTHGGDSDRVAPIIPLFGDKTTGSRRRAVKASVVDDVDVDAGTPSDRHPARGAASKLTSPAGSEISAPEISAPDIGASGIVAAPEAIGTLRDTGVPERKAPKLRALRDPGRDLGEAGDQRSPEEIRATGEEALLRKLRAKSLSISEARLILRGYHLDAAQIDEVIDDFCRRSYLDDAILADLLVTSGVERKGQGRVAVSRALSQRGIPRDVIDAALDELPDDDSERALDFARTKARSMSRLDNDTALRRLVGQLSRRGYNGAVAMNAAKAALREVASGGPTSGVRFVDSD